MAPSSYKGHIGLAPESTCFSPAPPPPQPSMLPASLACFILGTFLLVLLSPSLPWSLLWTILHTAAGVITENHVQLTLFSLRSLLWLSTLPRMKSRVLSGVQDPTHSQALWFCLLLRSSAHSTLASQAGSLLPEGLQACSPLSLECSSYISLHASLRSLLRNRLIQETLPAHPAHKSPLPLFSVSSSPRRAGALSIWFIDVYSQTSKERGSVLCVPHKIKGGVGTG